MKLTCPSCGAGGSASLFIADADARKAVLAAASLPSDCGAWTLKYISLFAPKSKFLTSTRFAKLITECCDMIISGVDFDREHITAPSHVWQQAFMQILDQQDLRRPLKNHHYLLRIVQSNLTRRNDIEQASRADSRRNAEPSRIRTSSMQPISQALEDKGALPEIPATEREAWLTKAHTDLLDKGMNKKFIIAPLVEQRAREMYAEE